MNGSGFIPQPGIVVSECAFVLSYCASMQKHCAIHSHLVTGLKRGCHSVLLHLTSVDLDRGDHCIDLQQREHVVIRVSSRA